MRNAVNQCDLRFRMSLQFDPEFVADQVVILEAGLQEMGERFLATSQKIGLLNTALSDKNAQLRSTSDSKTTFLIG